MKTLTFTLAELPPGLNAIKKMHWAVYRQHRDRWLLLVREAIGREMRSYPGKVSVEYHAYRVQLMDKDNHHGSFKLVGDALVKLGILRDDSPKVIDEDLSKYVQEHVSHYNEQRIEITIQDLEKTVDPKTMVVQCGSCSRIIDTMKTPYRKAKRSGRCLCTSCYLQLNHELKAQGMGPAAYELIEPKEVC